MPEVSLDAVQMDTSIQCRAAIDTAVVNDYAERMQAGDEFPSIDVYGSKSKCWIGDGWHRVMAARQRGSKAIAAKVHAGGRVDALKHALGANAMHGHRRSNADKRRAVEIALREFPKLSSRAVAKLCGVGHEMVETARPQLAETASSKRTGMDGKERPARVDSARFGTAGTSFEAFGPGTTAVLHGSEAVPRLSPAIVEAQRRVFDEMRAGKRPVLGPPRNGMQFARMAVMDLEQIREDDAERAEAFALVREWIDARET